MAYATSMMNKYLRSVFALAQTIAVSTMASLISAALMLHAKF